MVLGINYLTRELEGAPGENKYYDSIGEIENAIDSGLLSYNARIRYKLESGEKIETTPGRVLFNAVLPSSVPFQNMNLGDKELRTLIGDTLKANKNTIAVEMPMRSRTSATSMRRCSGRRSACPTCSFPRQKRR